MSRAIWNRGLRQLCREMDVTIKELSDRKQAHYVGHRHCIRHWTQGRLLPALEARLAAALGVSVRQLRMQCLPPPSLRRASGQILSQVAE